MPIEIRELVIRATITDAEKPESGSESTDTEDIVKICVDQVLKILERKKER